MFSDNPIGLRVDSLRHSFGSKVILDDLCLECRTGEVTGLLGRSGSGKTTLMRIIAGELRPSQKYIALNGEALITGRRKKGMMNRLPQHHFIPRQLKVRGVCRDYSVDDGRFVHLFPEFENKMDMRFGKLSGGEKRLLEVYAILCSKTVLTMLDEPFSILCHGTYRL